MSIVLEELIAEIKDFPKPGIIFRDITSLLTHPEGFKNLIDQIIEHCKNLSIDKIVAIESRGFFLGGALSYVLGKGLVLARKKGKLPRKTLSQAYDLEYGQAEIEIHCDDIKPGDRCLVIDDLLATGGTAYAVCSLVEQLGGTVESAVFAINLTELSGTEKIARFNPLWVVSY